MVRLARSCHHQRIIGVRIFPACDLLDSGRMQMRSAREVLAGIRADCLNVQPSREAGDADETREHCSRNRMLSTYADQDVKRRRRHAPIASRTLLT